VRNSEKKQEYYVYDEKRAIIENISEIKKQLDILNQNFQMETDEYLIDSLIYEIQALNKRYQYFLKAAKRKGFTARDF
jgi:glucosamine 6-phosphate synthetase-like amidotransferase/phosphosugar isomerase protein